MMKNPLNTTKLVLIIITFSTLLSACNTSVTGEGPVTEVRKSVDKFSKVDIQMEANVMVTQGLENAVVIHSQQNIADVIEVVIAGKTLKIYSNKYLSPSEPVRIDITMNTIEGLEISGSGLIQGTGTIKTPKISLNVSGSGKINLDLVCNTIKSDISGSGEMTLKGSATESNHRISGSGSLFAYDLLSQETKIEISGSGNAQLTATNSLIAEVSGSGNISYKGNPAKVNDKVTGSGKIKPARN